LEDLKNIVDACASGDPKAQEQLYNLYAPKMFGVCMRYAKNDTEAEDNLQEGFIKVFTNIGKFRHEGSLEGWVRRIMVNVSLEKFRKQSMLYPVEDMAVFESQMADDTTSEKVSATELLKLVQQLPPQYRMVFNLYVVEGFSHQEISGKLGIATGTSKSNLARAREILKRKVQKLFSEIETNANYSV